MLPQIAFKTGVCLGMALGFCSAAGAKGPPQTSRLDAPQADAKSAALVRQALNAGANGKTLERDTLLREALDAAPDNPLANWAAGRVRFGGAWRAISDAEQLAVTEPVLVQYRALRAQQPSTAEGERFLAVWCRKNHLDSEAAVHWRRVLNYEPDDAEALRQSGLRSYNGALLTTAEINEQKQLAGRILKATEAWKPKLAIWRHNLNGKDEKLRRQAMAEIQAIDDVDVIPVFEEMLAKKSADNSKSSAFAVEFVRTLAKMRQPAAAEATLRQAVLSDWPEVRQAATAALARRDLIEYIPYALGCMRGPIQRKVEITVADNGDVLYRQELSREGAEVDDYQVIVKEFRPDGALHLLVRPQDPAAQSMYAAGQTRAMARAQMQAEMDEQKLAAENECSATLNQAIRDVLQANTGQDFGSNAEGWWNWWRRYNEVSAPYAKPLRQQAYYRYYAGLSCFVAGTQVSTQTGLMSIESIRPGDRVLAQDPISGELAYKPVLFTTIRTPSPIRKIQVGSETILATRGHRFWQEGQGWRMAKELESGAWLHAVGGPVAIDRVEDANDQVAYNLVVADFHTYFVGAQRLLVHDSSVPRPVEGPTPGLVENAAP